MISESSMVSTYGVAIECTHLSWGIRISVVGSGWLNHNTGYACDRQIYLRP